MACGNTELSKEEKELLKNHRQRLRQRYVTQDTDYMNDARLLELLITYSIKQKDVYKIALRLLARFGSLEGVLSASIDELCKIPGIGKESAILVNLFSAFQRRCVLSQNSRKAFKDTDDIGKKICELYYGIKGEKALVLCFDASMKLVNYEWLSHSSPVECDIDQRELTKIVLRDEIVYVAIAHNHPNKKLSPSKEDILVHMDVNKLFASLDIKFIDTFIVSGDCYCQVEKGIQHILEKQRENESEISYVFDSTFDDLDCAEMAECMLKYENEIIK